MRRPVTIVIAVVAVALGSLMAIRQMPRDIFPSLGIPTIYVAQPYGGMDPSQMEAYLTYYYEYHFLYITGIEHIESKSIQSAALIKLQFYPGTDMAQAMSETVAEVDRSRAFMPPGTVPPFVLRFDAGGVPVGDLVFSSDTRSVREMQDEALNRVRPMFSSLPGVSGTPPFGGSARSIVINVKPDRLRAYNMSPDEIVSAILSANLISPSGNIPIAGMYPMVPLNSVVKNIQDLESVPIRSGVYPAIFLRDVATIEDGTDIVTCYAIVNGHRTVYMPVTKRADASLLSVVNSVKKNLPRFQAVLPPDVKVSYEFDQSPYVTRAISGLTIEGALGALLSGLMVLLFLGDVRSALLVVIIIPLSLMAALLFLWATGQTVNIMTLGGLALAVGILVDQATVCIENIHVHHGRGEHMARASCDGAVETAAPQLLAMLCILAMFTPALFMVGAAKAMFLPMSLAVGFSMVASYFLAYTLLPILTIWFLRAHEQTAENMEATERGFGRFREQYTRLAQWVVHHRKKVVAVYLLAAGAVIVIIGTHLGTEIFPRVDTGQFLIRLRAPTGTQIDGTEAVSLKVLDIIKKEVGPDNVGFSLGFIGVHSANYAVNLIYLWNEGPQEAVLQVQLKKGTPVAIEELKERLREKFAEQLPDVKFSFEPGDVVSQVMSLGSNTPIEVAVSGLDLSQDRAFAEKVREKLTGIKALRDVQFGQSLDFPTVNVTVDRERAGIMGVQMSRVSHALTTATWSSRFVTPIYWSDTNTGVAYQVQVQVPQAAMRSTRRGPEYTGGLSRQQADPRSRYR